MSLLTNQAQHMKNEQGMKDDWRGRGFTSEWEMRASDTFLEIITCQTEGEDPPLRLIAALKVYEALDWVETRPAVCITISAILGLVAGVLFAI